jgi:hypothetical protein
MHKFKYMDDIYYNPNVLGIDVTNHNLTSLGWDSEGMIFLSHPNIKIKLIEIVKC